MKFPETTRFGAQNKPAYSPIIENCDWQDAGQKSFQLNGVEAFSIQKDRTDFDVNVTSKRSTKMIYLFAMAATLVIVGIMVSQVNFTNNAESELPIEGGAWSSKAEPFSVVNPSTLGIVVTERPQSSRPGAVFGDLLKAHIPLPTNSWYENLLLGSISTDSENKVFQVPYILDTAGYIPGIRTHPAHVQANDRTVMMTYELENGLSLGAVEPFLEQHTVRSQGTPAISKLAIELEWKSDQLKKTGRGPSMRTPIVRGSPYTSMIYLDATPRLYIERTTSDELIIDRGVGGKKLVCGVGRDVFSAEPVLVNQEIKVQFDTSDMTWLIFLSEPALFVCSTRKASQSTENLPPGVVIPHDSSKAEYFELRAVNPMKIGMVRVAMSNNCTTGQNPQYCNYHQPRDNSEYEALLRNHWDVYPTAKADIEFTFPSTEMDAEDEELRLNFMWKPASIFNIVADITNNKYNDPKTPIIPKNELLMYAIPHHQERLRPVIGSSNSVQKAGCSPTIHGFACPVLGGSWSLVEHLHRASFSATLAPRDEMLDDIHAALEVDLKYEIPNNYMKGAGDTYFSGKMLAKLARVLIIANELGESDSDLFLDALGRLRAGVQVWLDGSSQSPLLYDYAWGGMVMCGCDYNGETDSCANSYPNCPALVDAGSNFGAGYYNDHHYHFGYHIYAAAVVSKFDHDWARKYHQHVLLLVRDIANPSEADPFFPTWRHKDWFLGFSWASGVVTIQGKPYPNGRNQESSSEAISAYEAIALYGEVMSEAYSGNANPAYLHLHENAMRIKAFGRLLLATETRSARTYWHVQSPGAVGVSRIYPDIYEPKVVGMIWSMLAQEQTWFGNEPWKSYGIQLLPLTVASEQRDSVGWVKEMLPIFDESCKGSPGCEADGWSILVYTCMATIGQWQQAWELTNRLNASVYEQAGGNGHSRTNTLWYIATRPEIVE
eukprot:gene9986-13436_t